MSPNVNEEDNTSLIDPDFSPQVLEVSDEVADASSEKLSQFSQH